MSNKPGNQSVAIEWYGPSDEGIAELQDDLSRLRAADPNAELELIDDRGLLPLVPFILGALGAVALAREISDLVCRIKKKGVIIDARVTPLKIRTTGNLPGGTVIIVGKDGASSTYSVCEGKVNLADLIKASAGGH